MKAFDYIAPQTLSEAVGLLAEHGDKARVLAGGTDLLVQVREGRRDLDWIVDVKHIPEVNELAFDPEKGLTLGASVPCYRIYENDDVKKHYPGLIDAVSLVGGIQIQSRASVGGNLCNGSPAADTIPPLIAADGVCVIAGPNGERHVPADQFCTAPGRTLLGPGEMLVSVRLPAPKPHSGSSYLRFIPRNEMDIAVVGVGVSVTLDEQKTTCTDARIGLAAVAPTPLLAVEAAESLIDTKLTDADIAKAASLAQSIATPISDMRGDSDYRKHLVGVLVKRTLRIATERAKEN